MHQIRPPLGMENRSKNGRGKEGKEKEGEMRGGREGRRGRKKRDVIRMKLTAYSF